MLFIKASTNGLIFHSIISEELVVKLIPKLLKIFLEIYSRIIVLFRRLRLSFIVNIVICFWLIDLLVGIVKNVEGKREEISASNAR